MNGRKNKRIKIERTIFSFFDNISESRAGPSNIGNVISQILLCKQITPDFNEEELCSIKKDSEEIGALIAELQEFMPQSEADTGMPIVISLLQRLQTLDHLIIPSLQP